MALHSEQADSADLREAVVRTTSARDRNSQKKVRERDLEARKTNQ